MVRIKIPVIRGAILPWQANDKENKGKPIARSVGRGGCPHAITDWLPDGMNGPRVRRSPYVFHCTQVGIHPIHRTGELAWK